MITRVYNILANHSNISWICCQCGLPSFSSSLFNTTPIELSNSFSSLDTTFASDKSPQPPKPIHTSTPSKTTKTAPSKPNFFNRPLRVLNINFQSVKNKTIELEHVIHSTKPDIIIGTETWLNSNINSIEIFKPDWGYTVYRKDRPNQSYGGVLIAVSNNLISSEATELDTTCEILWVHINLIGCKSLHFGAFYRPPRNDLDPLFQLDASLSRITHTTNGYVWLGGDFNARFVNWTSLEVSPAAGSERPQNQKLIDVSLDHNLEQVVDKPTREDKILDLLFTNNKSSLQKIEILPGIGKSDHEIVFAEIDTQPCRISKPKRNIFLYRKADWDGIRSNLNSLYTSIKNANQGYSANDLWTKFKSTLTSSMDEYIPQKKLNGKHHLPWVTPKIKKMIRKRNKIHTKSKKLAKPSARISKKLKNIRHSLQKEMRQAYWQYIENIIDYSEEDNNSERKFKQKKFWSFIKNMRKDSAGVAPLRSQRDTFSDASDKAKILNNQFSSVFTQEPIGSMPDKGPSSFPSMKLKFLLLALKNFWIT